MSDYENGYHQATTAATPGSLEPIHTHTLYIYIHSGKAFCSFSPYTDVPFFHFLHMFEESQTFCCAETQELSEDVCILACVVLF